VTLERRFEERRERECLRKNRYPTEAEARAAAAEQERRTATRLGVYQCLFCKGWHLTKRQSP
jgi:hypothetical protein